MDEVKRIEAALKKKKLLRRVIAAGLLLIAVFIAVNAAASGPLAAAAAKEAEHACAKLINEAFLDTMSECGRNGLTEGLTKQTSDGETGYLYIDSAKISVIAASVVRAAQERLEGIDSIGVSLPAGTLSGAALLSGRGARLKAYIEPLGAVTSRLESRFEAAGVNQTRYIAELELRAQIRVLIGGRAETAEVSCALPLCEAIVVGAVPHAYTDVSSLEDALNLIPTDAD